MNWLILLAFHPQTTLTLESGMSGRNAAKRGKAETKDAPACRSQTVDFPDFIPNSKADEIVLYVFGDVNAFYMLVGCI